MNNLRWIFSRWLDNVGIAGIISWLLLVSLFLYGYYIFLPDYKRFAVLEDVPPIQLTQKQQILRAYQSPAEHMFSQMPDLENTPLSIQIIFDMAEQHDLYINEVVYKDEQKRGEKTVRYNMSFSVEAAYPDIKAFIVNVLAELPLLALEQLSFERTTKQDDITAHLRFTLYMVKSND